MTSARFWQILPPSPLSATVSIERPPPPLMTSAFARPPPPPFQSDISFLRNPLHSTLIETLNVYLIQLKTKRLGEYINAVVSRIVIGPLDLKQFSPKFKYFADVSNRQHFETPPPSAADVICERSLTLKTDFDRNIKTLLVRNMQAR